MNFLNRLVQASGVLFGKTKQEVGNWRPLSVDLLGRASNYKAREYMKEYGSWVFANIRVISQAVSVIKFHLMKAEGKNVKEVTEHPFLDILYRPNQFTTKSDFIKLITSYLLSAGEAPIRLKRKDPQNPKELPTEAHLLKPYNVTVKVGRTADNFEVLTGYEIGDSKGNYDLNPWEMVFINNLNPNNIWRGIGIVEAAAMTIDSINYAEEYNINFFKNSAVPYAALYTDQELSDESWARLKNNMETNFGSYKNAFKTMILEAGLKIEKLQSTAKDMDFVEQQRYSRDKLMSLFGTSKAILGITEDVNRANAEASEYVFMKYTVKPIMEQITEYLNEFLLPVFDPTGTLFLTFDDPVPENTQVVTDDLDRLTNKVYSINEARAKRNLPPVDNGDKIYLPFSLAPMGEGISADMQKILSFTIQKPGDSEKYKEQIIRLNNRNLRRKMLAREIKKALKSVLEKDTDRQFKGPKYKDARSKSSTDLYVKSVLKKADDSEALFFSQTVKYYDAQLKEILVNLGNSKSKAVATNYLFDKKESVKIGVNLLTPVVEKVIIDQGSEAFDLLGIGKPYSVLEEARRYLKKEPVKFIRSMTETAYERARNSLAEGLDAGESVPQLSSRVKAEYLALKTDQAKTVARTEVMRATNFAQVDAYDQSGVVEGKEWIVTEDDRLCEFCMAMEQEYESKLELGDKFFKKGDTVAGIDGGTMTLEYSDVDAPPLHPSCRCVTIPILEPIKQISDRKKESDGQKERGKLGGENQGSGNGT